MRLVEGAAIVIVCMITLISAAAAQPPEDGEQDSNAQPPAEEPADGDAPEEDPADVTSTCLASFSAAQAHRRRGQLVAARQALIRCSQPTCPEEIVGKCTPWLREVKESLPSIIVVARDAEGNDLPGAKISVDGTAVDATLHGRPIELDPGTHTLLVEPAGHPSIEMQVVVVYAEKNRVIVAKVAPPKPPPSPPAPPPPAPFPVPEPAEPAAGGVSPWVWVGFGVGAAGIAAGVVTGVMAIDAAQELEETCNGTLCSTTDEPAFDDGVQLAHGSTASFVIGGAGVLFGVAALIWLGDEPKGAALRLGPGHLSLRGSF